MTNQATSPTYFAAPEAFRAWLSAHHADETVLWVGFYRRATGRPSLTWPESVDEALCFGWIDGLRKGVDDERYMIRFAPRTPKSRWSAVNVARMRELIRTGRAAPAGIAAFEAREGDAAGYSYEQRKTVELGEELERVFRAEPAAWAFFQAQPPGYRRTATWWVVSAKREETRRRRLQTLIDASAARRRVEAVTGQARSE